MDSDTNRSFQTVRTIHGFLELLKKERPKQVSLSLGEKETVLGKLPVVVLTARFDFCRGESTFRFEHILGGYSKFVSTDTAKSNIAKTNERLENVVRATVKLGAAVHGGKQRFGEGPKSRKMQ